MLMIILIFMEYLLSKTPELNSLKRVVKEGKPKMYRLIKMKNIWLG